MTADIWKCSCCGETLICPKLLEKEVLKGHMLRDEIERLKIDISGRSRITEFLQYKYERAIRELEELKKVKP